jgi:hypothetical protein
MCQIINLTNFLGTKSSPLGSLPKLLVIDAHILFPPLDVLAPKTKKKWSYDSTQKFQVERVVKKFWVELQVGFNGCLHTVKCTICS